MTIGASVKAAKDDLLECRIWKWTKHFSEPLALQRTEVFRTPLVRNRQISAPGQARHRPGRLQDVRPMLRQVHSLEQGLEARVGAVGVEERLVLNQREAFDRAAGRPRRALQTSRPLRRQRRNRLQPRSCDRASRRASAPIPGCARDRQPDSRPQPATTRPLSTRAPTPQLVSSW